MPGNRRQDLLREGVIEAARAVMAQTLVRERRMGLADVTAAEADALQTLRDACAAERSARTATPETSR
jgi:hypothetical protein